MSVTTPPDDSRSSVDLRLAALEAAVARLSAMFEPGLAAASIASPVAIPALKETAQHEFSAKFFALLDTGEALVKYSAAMAFASLLEGDGSQAAEVMEAFKQAPTLGKWVELLRKVLVNPGNEKWPLRSVRESLLKHNGKPTPIARYLLEEFVPVRNRERGHGAQQPEGYYEGLYLKNHLHVQDCLTECKYLQVPLVHVQSVDPQKDGYAYRTTLLMGASPRRGPTPILTASMVPVGSTCVWDHGQQLVPLGEFVMFQYCSSCSLEHVFFLERIEEGTAFYHSYIGNHRIVKKRTSQ